MLAAGPFPTILAAAMSIKFIYNFSQNYLRSFQTEYFHRLMAYPGYLFFAKDVCSHQISLEFFASLSENLDPEGSVWLHELYLCWR